MTPEKLVAPPPPITAPTVPGATKFAVAPAIILGAPLVLGSNRSARKLLALSSSGWLSVVPRKLMPGVVPALPDKPQPVPPPVAAICMLLLVVVTVTLAPAAIVTASVRPLRVLTTCPAAILFEVTELSARAEFEMPLRPAARPTKLLA